MPLHQIRIPLDLCSVYASCPKKFDYSKDLDKPADSDDIRLLKDVLRTVYVDQTKSLNKTTWKRLSSIVNKFFFGDSQLFNKELYNLSVKYLGKIQNQWYNKYYKQEERSFEAIGAIQCKAQYGSVEIYDNIDLVLFDAKDIILCHVTDIEDNARSIYNDIRLRGQALLLSKELGFPVTQIRIISWGESGKINQEQLFIHDPPEFHATTEKSLSHIATGIKNKVFYVSRNEQCNSCPFYSVCSW